MSFVRAVGGVLGQQGGAAFDPLSLNWHSVYWADGPSMTGYADTDAVTAWYNETAESDALQGTPSLQPSFAATSTINSKPAVEFVGSLDKLTATFSTAATRPVSVVLIAKCDNPAVTVTTPVSGTNQNKSFITSSAWNVFAGSVVTGGTATTSPFMSVTYFDGSTGNEKLWVDGNLVINANAGSGNDWAAVAIGNNIVSEQPWDGPIAFVGIYEGDITADGNWAAFEAWVTSHYGITIA